MPRQPEMIDDPASWLLEPENPSVRYFTLLYLVGLPPGSPELAEARQAIYAQGPAPAILALQSPAGWWDNPENATKPLYRSTLWQLNFLAELGASAEVPAIRCGAEILLDTVQSERGDFPNQSGTYHKFTPADMLCSDGIPAWAMLRLGFGMEDPRMARAVHFLADILLSPALKCHFNHDFPCTWGMSKALRALAALPPPSRSEEVNRAISKTAEYFLANDPGRAGFPLRPGGHVSAHWFELGFPRSYQSDLLELAVTLTHLGYAADPRFKPLAEFLLSKRRMDGVWKLEETIPQMPVPFEPKGKPSKWITWQAWYVLKTAGYPTPF